MTVIICVLVAKKMTDLIKKIQNKDVKIAVIGLGYVGLPLAVEFVKCGFTVTGIDTSKKKINSLKKYSSYIEDVPNSSIEQAVKSKKLRATDGYSKLSESDVIIICVPTPMRKSKEPDVSYVINAAKQISKYMKKQQLVILESTTYPGTTDELILPILCRKKKKAGSDFFLAFSPERVDPGNKKYTTPDIPKVVGGVTPRCLSRIILLYKHVFSQVVPVSSTKVAETIKLLENTYRTVNIALVNEIAQMCHKMGIDVWEVIKGASTKPFGFMPFYPGPGIGGACLPKDPVYLAWKARHYDFHSRFIDIASDITTLMPRYIVQRIQELLKEKQNKNLKGSRVFILGVAYKKDLGDTRDSPALEIIRILKNKGAVVKYNDPYVPKITVGKTKFTSKNITPKELKDLDIVLITTNHTKYDIKQLIKASGLLFDTRGVTWELRRGNDNVHRL